MGAALAALLVWLWHRAAVPRMEEMWLGEVVWGGLLLLFSILGAACARHLQEEWGADPARFVWDEMVGMWLAVWLLPFSPGLLLAAFLLFRFFDIAKPLGIRKMEHLPNGWGVMADDLLAACYANLILQLWCLW